jgi:hypothetical protein
MLSSPSNLINPSYYSTRKTSAENMPLLNNIGLITQFNTRSHPATGFSTSITFTQAKAAFNNQKVITVLELTTLHEIQRISTGIRKFTHNCKLWVVMHVEESGCGFMLDIPEFVSRGTEKTHDKPQASTAEHQVQGPKRGLSKMKHERYLPDHALLCLSKRSLLVLCYFYIRFRKNNYASEFSSRKGT